ncbi:hypothetical protein DL96DRAFT_1708387 [Flagelloscypha sp. PMI_526]|nr:hypothetical protein DL96DRAFT_1708387 [Flagelloscypha sp. PMI_526]
MASQDPLYVPFKSTLMAEPHFAFSSYPPFQKKKQKPVPDGSLPSTSMYPNKPSPTRSGKTAASNTDAASRKRTSSVPPKSTSSQRKRRDSELLLTALEQVSAKLSKSEAQRKALEDRLTTIERRPVPLSPNSPSSSAVLQQQVTTQAVNATAREYMLRLQNAERELENARRAVRSLEDSKEDAERETKKARAAARRLRMEHQMHIAREQGWSRGLQEGRIMAQDLLEEAALAASQHGLDEDDTPTATHRTGATTIYSSDGEHTSRAARSKASKAPDRHHRRRRAASLDSSHADPSESHYPTRSTHRPSRRSHTRSASQADPQSSHAPSVSQSAPQTQPASIPERQESQPRVSHSKSERGHRAPRSSPTPAAAPPQPVHEPPPIEPVVPPATVRDKDSRKGSTSSTPAPGKYDSAILAALARPPPPQPTSVPKNAPGASHHIPYVPMPPPPRPYAERVGASLGYPTGSGTSASIPPVRPPLNRLQTGFPGRPSSPPTGSSAGTGTIQSMGFDLLSFPNGGGANRFPRTRESEERMKQERALSEKQAELRRMQADLELRSLELRNRELQRLEKEMQQKSRELAQRGNSSQRNLDAIREAEDARAEGGSTPYIPPPGTRERERRQSVEQWRQKTSGTPNRGGYLTADANGGLGRRGSTGSRATTSVDINVQPPSPSSTSSSTVDRVRPVRSMSVGAQPGTMAADAAFGHPGNQIPPATFVPNRPPGPYSSAAVHAGEQGVGFPQPTVPNIVGPSGGPSFPEATVPNIVGSSTGPSFPQPSVPSIVGSSTGPSFPQPTVPNLVGPSFPQATVPSIVPPPGQYSPAVAPGSVTGGQPIRSATYPMPSLSVSNAGSGPPGTPGGLITPRMSYQAAEVPPGIRYPSPPTSSARAASQTQPMAMPSPNMGMPVIPGVNTGPIGTPNRRSMSLAPTPSSLASSLPAANFPTDRRLRRTSTRRRTATPAPGTYTSSSSGSSSSSSTEEDDGVDHFDEVTRRNTQANTGYTPRPLQHQLPSAPMGMLSR